MINHKMAHRHRQRTKAFTGPVLLSVFLAAVWLPGILHASPISSELIALGEEELKSKEYLKALEYFDFAIRADQADASGYYHFGLALNRLQQYQRALKWLRRAEARGYDDPGLHFELGMAALGAGEYGFSKKELQRYLEAADEKIPYHAQAHFYLGEARYALQEYDAAASSFERAMALNSGFKKQGRSYLEAIRKKAT